MALTPILGESTPNPRCQMRISSRDCGQATCSWSQKRSFYLHLMLFTRLSNFRHTGATSRWKSGVQPEKSLAARAQIGKALKIGPQSFSHDNNLLWLGTTPCKNVHYKMRVESSDESGKGSLGSYGLESAEVGQFVIVNCDKQDVCSLELAKNQELAVYFDGWFFFLRKRRQCHIN
jgi:hypothetical protein